jgi:ribosomal protein L40E
MSQPEHEHAGAQDPVPARPGELDDARPPGRDRALHATVCRKCGANEHVHRGLCRRCRRLSMGESRVLPPESIEKPHEASPEPLHNPPWRRRGA